MVKLAVIEGCGANLTSVKIALERLAVDHIFTHDANIIKNADLVLLPGVGSAGFAMKRLAEYNLIDVIRNLTQPLLGICLGMQLLYEFSEEGSVDCLGVIPGVISKFSASLNLVIPHMGWNNLTEVKGSPLLNGITNPDVYFVHSYKAPINEATIASCNYGGEFTAICNFNNFYGMQFHPEKSGEIGGQLLNNFINLPA